MFKAKGSEKICLLMVQSRLHFFDSTAQFFSFLFPIILIIFIIVIFIYLKLFQSIGIAPPLYWTPPRANIGPARLVPNLHAYYLNKPAHSIIITRIET